MKNLFLFLFLLVVFTSKAQDNRVSGLNSPPASLLNTGRLNRNRLIIK